MHDDDPDREPRRTAPSDLGDRFQQQPELRRSSSSASRRSTGVRERRTSARRSRWRSTARRSPSQIFQGSQSRRRSFVSPVVAGYRDEHLRRGLRVQPGRGQGSCTTAAGGPADDQDHVQRRRRAQGLGRRDLQPAQGEPGRRLHRQRRAEVRRPADQGRERSSRSACSAWAGSWTTRRWRTTSARSTRPTARRTTTATATRQFDSLVAEGSAAPTPDEAIEKYQQAEDILAQDMPVIPLRFGQNVFGHSTKVTNVEIDLFRPGRPLQDRSRRQLTASDGGGATDSRTVAPPLSGRNATSPCSTPATSSAEEAPDMSRYIVRRLLQMILTFFGTTLHRVRADVRQPGRPASRRWPASGRSPTVPAQRADRAVPPRRAVPRCSTGTTCSGLLTGDFGTLADRPRRSPTCWPTPGRSPSSSR